MEISYLIPFLISAINLRLVIISGESNSGGYGDNSLVPTDQLGDRSTVKILNNTTLASFDTLHISTVGDGLDNTHIGHSGSSDWGASHGWELGLANMAETGIISKPLYLVKTGQGGSIIEQWKPGSIYTTEFDYQTMFNNRADAALSLLNITQSSNKFILLYSQGLNNRTSDMPNWTNKTLERFNYLRDRYGMFPIIMTKFNSDYQNVSDAVEQVCNRISNCFFIDADGLAMRDILHWNYPATVEIPNRMFLKAKEKGYTF